MSQVESKALWDLIALSGAEALAKLAGFVAFATLARLFSPQDYGSLELAISLLVFFATFIDFGLGPIGSREVARDDRLAAHYASLIPTTRLVLLAMALPLMLATGWFINVPESTVTLIMVVSLALLMMPFNQKWLLQGLERMTWVSLGQAVHMLVFMIGVLLWVRYSPSLPLVAAIEVFATFATAAWFVFLQYRIALPIRLNFDWPAIGHLMKQALPVGSGRIVWAFNQNIPLLLIGVLSSAAEVAWYAVAMRVVNALLSFSMIYHFNLYPNVVNRLQQSHAVFLGLSEPSFRLCAWAGTAVALIITLIADPLITLAFGDGYAQGATSLAILVWVVPVTLLSSHSRWALVASNKQHYVLHSYAGGVGVCVVACLLMVPRWGSIGACTAMLLSCITVWAISHYYACRWVGQMPLKSCIVPLLIASALVGIVQTVNATSWSAIALTLVTFCLSIALFDRQLPVAIQTLIQIKNVPTSKPA